MTTKEIEDQLQEELTKFNNKTYSGKIDVPQNILELFKKAAMALAPYFHQINMQRIKVIASKDIHELTHGDLKDVIKMILNTPLEKLYGDRFEDAMNAQIQLQKFIICYNNIMDEFTQQLKMRKATLTDLTRNVNPGANGLRLMN